MIIKEKRTMKYKVNHFAILYLMNKGITKINKIYKETNLSYRTITEHKRNIIECPNCKHFINKDIICDNCGFEFTSEKKKGL